MYKEAAAPRKKKIMSELGRSEVCGVELTVKSGCRQIELVPPLTQADGGHRPLGVKRLPHSGELHR